jgi:predicted  nucleic acid-binding Zn-ribbon protein
MLDILKQLLNLQNLDQKLAQLQSEIVSLEPQRKILKDKAAEAESRLLQAKDKLKHIEADRKKAELEVESLKESINKYSIQQFQTKKNDEYQALSQQIEHCKQQIIKLEDLQLQLMETAETVQKEISIITQETNIAKSLMEEKIKQLNSKESQLRSDFDKIFKTRQEYASTIDPSFMTKYDRLFKQKNGKPLARINNGVCDGCHMKLPPQVVINCQTATELVNCPNCSRILYLESQIQS